MMTHAKTHEHNDTPDQQNDHQHSQHINKPEVTAYSHHPQVLNHDLHSSVSHVNDQSAIHSHNGTTTLQHHHNSYDGHGSHSGHNTHEHGSHGTEDHGKQGTHGSHDSHSSHASHGHSGDDKHVSLGSHHDSHGGDGGHDSYGGHDSHGGHGGHDSHGGHGGHGGHDSHGGHGGHDSHGGHGGHDSHRGHGGHDSHGGHGGHDSHGAHGGHDSHGAHGGHDSHGGHGGHDSHGAHGGHGGHGDGLNLIGVGALLSMVVLLGIPTLFSELDRILDNTSIEIQEEIPNDGVMASYTVKNARILTSVAVESVQHSNIEAVHSIIPVVYLILDSGERFMAVDMDAFRSLGVSGATVHTSKIAYHKAKTLQPGTVNLKVTGEPPIALMLAGVAPLVLDIEGM